MKECITILVILILIFGGAYLTKKYLYATTEELIKKIDDFEHEAIKTNETGDRVGIMEKSKDIKSRWEEIEKGWGIIVLHEELDNIKTSIYKLSSNAEYGEFADCIEEAQKLKFLVGHIKEKEKFSLINIF